MRRHLNDVCRNLVVSRSPDIANMKFWKLKTSYYRLQNYSTTTNKIHGVLSIKHSLICLFIQYCCKYCCFVIQENGQHWYWEGEGGLGLNVLSGITKIGRQWKDAPKSTSQEFCNCLQVYRKWERVWRKRGKNKEKSKSR